MQTPISKRKNIQKLIRSVILMPTSQVYISTASRNALREIARKHFMKESEILEKFISDTHELMKKKGRKVL